MNVAIYTRVSLDENNKEDRRYQDPENQRIPLREWAEVKGWNVVRYYQDYGSGADPNREGFKAMLKDAMMLKFRCILVWKFDRFSREPMFTAVGRIQRLRERGVGIKSLTESWLDTGEDNPIGDVVISIMSWASAEERRKISERTRAGIQRRRNIGQWRGGGPRKIAKISEVCVLTKDNEWVCKECGKKFRDNSVFLRKWNAHRRRHEWLNKNNLIEKGPPEKKVENEVGGNGTF